MTALPPLSATLPPGWRHLALGSVESTNTEAMRRAAAGDAGQLWVTADEQVRGRGRSGRAWTSVPGNLYATAMLRMSCPVTVAHQLALVAGVAVVDAIGCVAATDKVGDPRADTSAAIRLKWPNDILIGLAKAGGILVETTMGAGGPGLVAAVGIGLNVAGVPEGLGRSVTSLAASGIPGSRSGVFGALAASLSDRLGTWNEGAGFAAIRRAWLERAGPVGERLAVNTGDGVSAGAFVGLDADGALLLKDDLGATRRFTYGDVTIAPSAGGK